jgi:predicted DNA-binding ribbon-helix-helix protein
MGVLSVQSTTGSNNPMNIGKAAQMSNATTIETRMVTVGTRKTQLSLDRRFWSGLEEICEREFLTMDELVTKAAYLHPDRPLGSVIEYVAVMYFWRATSLALEEADMPLELRLARH